ncbi:hypothetical protein PMAYCL1PPCAC_24765, partial [Pristionchus mayeri]
AMVSDSPSGDGTSKVKFADGAPFGKIRWEVGKDLISQENSYSHTIEVGGIPWRIYARTSGVRGKKFLSVFLEQLDGDYKVNRMDAEFVFKLVHYDEDEKTARTFLFEYAFDKDARRGGYPDFIQWQEAVDERKVFL